MAETAVHQTQAAPPSVVWGGLAARRRANRVMLYGVIGALVLIFAFPLYNMVITSLMTQFETYIWPPLLYPRSWQFYNYIEMATRVPLVQWFWNTTQITILSVLGTTLSCTVVAYGFARFRFPLHNALFLLTLGTMMFPAQITMIPQFILYHELGWLNTFKPLIVPSFFGGGAFFIFLMRQFIMQIPRDLDEAALIDGANPFRVLTSILMPLIKPAIGTVAIISFMGVWNDFQGPLIYLTSNRLFTLAVGLRYWDTQPALGELSLTHLMMAMCVVVALPCIILFFSAQKIFVEGIVMSGIKG
jgi:multiple sugar transport system permease protein